MLQDRGARNMYVSVTLMCLLDNRLWNFDPVLSATSQAGCTGGSRLLSISDAVVLIAAKLTATSLVKLGY